MAPRIATGWRLEILPAFTMASTMVVSAFDSDELTVKWGRDYSILRPTGRPWLS